MKTCLLFDLDGTLLDTLGDLCGSVNFALAQAGLPGCSMEQVRSYVGNGARNLIFRAVQGDEARVPEVLATFQTHYRQHCRDLTRPYPGILEQLALLADLPMAIVSNKPDAAVGELARLYFPGLLAMGERAGIPRKPASDMLRLAMAELGAEQCIYIGDSEVDVTTAKNAGVPCLSVSWGFRDEETLRRAGADHICRDPRELCAVLRQMHKELEQEKDMP